MTLTPGSVISYLNTLVNAALAAGEPKLYFPLFSTRVVTVTGIQDSAQHAYQGRYGDSIKAAQGVLDKALRGIPRTVEAFRVQYADWQGPGKPPAWLDSVTAALSAMGAFAGPAFAGPLLPVPQPPTEAPVTTLPPGTPPPVVTPPAVGLPSLELTTASLFVHVLDLERRVKALGG